MLLPNDVHVSPLPGEGLPVVFVVNKLDRERASFERCLGEIQDRFGRTAVPVQLPIGQEHDVRGVVDLIRMKALTFDPQSGAVEQ